MVGADPFHPDLRFARFLPKAAITRRNYKASRFGVRMMPPPGKPRPAVERVSDDVSVRVFRPELRKHDAALLWIHGGGFLVGAAKQDDELCRKFANTLGITVASVDYRLAPEHPFPTPLEDCYAALGWLRQQEGVAKIAVAGASAGAGLAAGLTIASRRRGAGPIACQVLFYPMIDDRTAQRDDVNESNLRLWNQAANRFAWASYLAGQAEVSPLAAPARCEDLNGLPPAWIGVGTNDLFHDEDVEYAARLEAAGIRTHLEVVPGAYHGFDSFAAKAPVVKSFHESAMAFVAHSLER